MEIVKWIFVVAALAGMALALVELATEKPDTTTDSDRLPDGLAGTWERKTPDGRMEATIADGAIEVVRVSGDSREVRWRGVYEAKGRKWVVREAPKESHTADTAYHDSSRTSSYSAPPCRPGRMASFKERRPLCAMTSTSEKP